MRADLTRRGFLASLGAAAGLSCAAARPALALTAGEARALVDAMVGDINGVIAAGLPGAQMIDRFERIFVRYSDLPTVARYALGVDARRASPDQMRAFTRAFRGYVARKYGKRFRDFIGGEIRVNAARPVKGYYEVATTAYLRGESPVAVDFMVSDKPGEPRFFNMKIEGINMLLSERTEIGAMLDRRGGDLDAMIADLRQAG